MTDQLPPTDRLIDVVIPVHREDRPVERAVASAVAGGLARAIVVCHNIEASVFAERLAPFGDAVVTLELHDSVPSPAGPFNTGLWAANAPWVTTLGSDDWLEPGAQEAWVAALADEPDVVVLPVLDQSDGSTDVPATRPGRVRKLDVVKDRLLYRTGPLWLVRTRLIHDHGIRMSAGLRTGEDLAFSTHMFLAAKRISQLPAGSPRYIEGDDAVTRVTREPFPFATLLLPVERLVAEPWVAPLPARHRHALAVRVVRKNLLPALALHREQLTVNDVAAARSALQAWLRLAPNLTVPLSRVEEAACVALLACAVPAAEAAEAAPAAKAAETPASGPAVERLRQSLGALSGASSIAKVMPRRLRGLCDPEARVRHFLARALSARYRRRWGAAAR